jgi:hypothetical protein
VLDVLRSEEEHVYDRWFHGVPDRSNGLSGIGLDMQPRATALGDTDGYEMVSNLSSAETTGDFNCGWELPNGYNLGMRVLNDEPLEAVHGFEWSRQYPTPDKEFLLLSRTVKNADFVVLYEPYRRRSAVSEFARFEVTDTEGNTVPGSIGVKVNIDGKSYEVILNPYNVTVQTVKGVSNKVLIISQ